MCANLLFASKNSVASYLTLSVLRILYGVDVVRLTCAARASAMSGLFTVVPSTRHRTQNNNEMC